MKKQEVSSIPEIESINISESDFIRYKEMNYSVYESNGYYFLNLKRVQKQIAITFEDTLNEICSLRTNAFNSSQQLSQFSNEMNEKVSELRKIHEESKTLSTQFEEIKKNNELISENQKKLLEEQQKPTVQSSELIKHIEQELTEEKEKAKIEIQRSVEVLKERMKEILAESFTDYDNNFESKLEEFLKEKCLSVDNIIKPVQQELKTDLGLLEYLDRLVNNYETNDKGKRVRVIDEEKIKAVREQLKTQITEPKYQELKAKILRKIDLYLDSSESSETLIIRGKDLLNSVKMMKWMIEDIYADDETLTVPVIEQVSNVKKCKKTKDKESQLAELKKDLESEENIDEDFDSEE